MRTTIRHHRIIRRLDDLCKGKYFYLLGSIFRVRVHYGNIVLCRRVYSPEQSKVRNFQFDPDMLVSVYFHCYGCEYHEHYTR